MPNAPETAATRARRRWITLGEIVAILALVISAAGYWDAHQDRVKSAAPVAMRPAPLLLTGSAATDRRTLALRPAHADQVVETQTLTFPKAVRDGSIDTTGNARIEAGWFESGLLAAIKHDKPGTHRIAVGIATSFVSGGETRTDSAVYDIGYTVRPRFLRGRTVQLEGVSLVQRVAAKDLAARVEARWAAQAPKA